MIGIFALWGLSQLVIGLLYLMAPIRYRSLIPLLYLLLIAEYAARMLIGGFKPVETAGNGLGAVGYLTLMVLAAVMLVLCLIPRKSN